MNAESQPPQRPLSTADLAAASQPRPETDELAGQQGRSTGAYAAERAAQASNEALAPLFTPDNAQHFRTRWDAVQTSFVDDPAAAVRQGDELVAQVMKSLAESFSSERARLEDQLTQSSAVSTEDLRLAFRRYRSFFERLLAL